MPETQFDREMEDPEMRRLYAQEKLIEEAAELVCAAMERYGISKAELADKAGASLLYVTTLLNGSREMTLHRLANLMHAMGERVVLSSEAE